MDEFANLARNLTLEGSAFTSNVEEPHGFHTTSVTYVDTTRPGDSCDLHVIYLLPPEIFIDPYDLERRAQEGNGPRFMLWGEVDLEAPVETVDQRGSVLLIEGPEQLSRPIDIELHLRYARPSKDGKLYQTTHAPWPWPFWACATSQSVVHAMSSPFKALPPPFQSPFPPLSTSFHFIPPAAPSSQHPFHIIKLPSGQMEHLLPVQVGTNAAVFLALLYIGLTSWRSVLSWGAKERVKRQ